jgi:hypothetical protein
VNSVKIGDSCKLVNFNPADIDLSAKFIKVRVRGLGGRTQIVISPSAAVSLIQSKIAAVINKWGIEILYNNRHFNTMVKEKASYTCYYCGKYGDTVDHFVPIAKGGLSTFRNCVCCCIDCNKIKGSMDAAPIERIKRKRNKKRKQRIRERKRLEEQVNSYEKT